MSCLNKTKNYLCSNESFGSNRNNVASIFILLVWLSIVIFVSAKHELWRDEVRALSIALEPESFWQLPMFLKNEGHPILWYFIIRFGYWVTQTPEILKIISICIGFGGVTLFFRWAPFPVWQKIIFLGGVLPVYEYTIMTRNYGISMLLFFLFAELYSQRKNIPLVIAIVLVALANTNVHSCILTCVFLALWFYDDIVSQYNFLTMGRTSILFIAFSLVAIGILFSVFTSLPNQDTIVIKGGSLTASHVVDAIWKNIKHPGITFDSVLFGFPTVLLRDLLLWLLIAGLLVQARMAISLFTGMVLLGSFFTVVYSGELRHQGIFIIFMISLYWIVRRQRPMQANVEPIKYLHFIHKISVYVVLSLIFIAHLIFSIKMIRNDILKEMSSSMAFGRFLNTHIEYKNAIIIGEPDYLLESLPYYLSNPIYIPREERFGKYVMFTKASKNKMSVGELLNIARHVKISEKRPVLIAFGHFDIFNGNKSLKYYSYNKVITWSPKELTDFRNETVRLAEFKSSLTDENYEIYLMRE